MTLIRINPMVEFLSIILIELYFYTVVYLMFRIFNGSIYKAHKKRMWLQNGTFKFWMELGTHKPWMTFKFDNFYKASIWVNSRNLHTCSFELIHIFIIEFVSMSMSLRNL